MNLSNPDLSSVDPEISGLIVQESKRQEDTLMLIPSENYTSQAVRQALSSVLTNKYSEGYPGKRYYQGNRFIDQIESLAIDRAKKLFGTPHANVQPYSGSPANLAVYSAVCKPNDTIMGLNLLDGGHLTHGWKVSITSQFYNSVPYHVDANGKVDFEEVKALAEEHKPVLIWCGATAYTYEYEFEQFARIADSVGAYLAADISHVAGLVAGGVHTSPVPFAHIVTSTTHKTLRGPRGALIMVTDKGLVKDADLIKKVDRAVFPGLQGGPHNHQTAGIAVALTEAATPEFKEYARQILVNNKALAKSLMDSGITLVGNGSENHLLLIDLRPERLLGNMAAEALEIAGIVVNRNTIPKDPNSAFYPSGLRLGTPAVTTRGMGVPEMEEIASYIVQVLDIAAKYPVSPDKTQWAKNIEARVAQMKNDKDLLAIGQKVTALCKRFPL